MRAGRWLPARSSTGSAVAATSTRTRPCVWSRGIEGGRGRARSACRVIRVVLDANVLVSAALARALAAPSLRAFDALLDERIEVVGCPVLLDEVASVLGRDRLRRYLSIDEARRFVADLAAVMSLVADPPPPGRAARVLPEMRVERLIAGLTVDELREVVSAAVDRHDDIERQVRLIAARAAGDLAQLRAEVESRSSHPQVPRLPGERRMGRRRSADRRRTRAGGRCFPSPALVELLQRAVGHVVNVIMHADDSDGLIGHPGPRSPGAARAGVRCRRCGPGRSGRMDGQVRVRRSGLLRGRPRSLRERAW